MKNTTQGITFVIGVHMITWRNYFSSFAAPLNLNSSIQHYEKFDPI